LSVFFALWGSASVKAPNRTFMKLTPVERERLIKLKELNKRQIIRMQKFAFERFSRTEEREKKSK
jgi:hypothetical protein